jgi:hypothetical protein
MTQETTSQRRPENGNSDQIKETAGQSKERVQEQVGSVATQAQDQVKSRLATQKDSAAESLSGVAQALRQTGQQLRDQNQSAPVGLLDEAAAQVERLSGYLQGNDLNRLVGDIESFARRQPALFLGGAFLVGLVGARFLKSTRPTQFDQGGYGPMDDYRRDTFSTTYSGYSSGYTSGMGSGYSSGTGGSYGTGTGGSYGTGAGTGAQSDSEFSSGTSTGYGGASPGIYDAPERTTDRQTTGSDQQRERSYGERLEE